LSSNVVESGSLIDAAEAPPPVPVVSQTGSLRPVVAVLAPLVAAGTALLIQRLLPIRQEHGRGWMDALSDWQHPYPVLLAGLLAMWVLVAVGQWLWRPLSRWATYYGPLVAGGLVIVCLWDLITAKLAWMPHPYFPCPDEVLGGMIEDREMLLVSTLHSLRLLAIGYAGGVTAGLITGVLIGWFTRARYWGMPIMKFLGPLPATALVPLVMMLPIRDYLFLSGAALICFATWFPVTMLTASGIANVRLSYLDVARTLGAGRLYLIFRVAIPSALPNIFVGLFQGLGASFLTLIAAETLGVRAGLGWYIGYQKSSAEYAKVYASLFIMALFFSFLMTLLFKVRDRVLRWQKGVIKW
jgi:NitT/TauT family transport system permease protein